MNYDIPLATPHMMGNEMAYVQDCFNTNWLAPAGPYLKRFEDAIRKYTGVSGAVALSSGTASLHLALKMIGVGAGDLVACQSFTFVATANPILYCGATPVFIDSDMESKNMSAFCLGKALEQHKIKAVVVVHLYGMPADMKNIMDLCTYYGVPLIEDATESLGSTYHGRHMGTFGEIGCLSFNGNKIITTTVGGMLISNNTKYTDNAVFLATQAKDPSWCYQHSQIGFNYRMSNVCASIGVGQMEHIDEKIQIKRHIFERYREAFKDEMKIAMYEDVNGRVSNHWLSCCQIEGVEPKEIIERLALHSIEARAVWKPMHLQPLFEKYPYVTADGEDICGELFATSICLPSDTKMTDAEQDMVIRLIKKYVQEKAT